MADRGILNIDDAVIHIPEGVCRVTDVIEREIEGFGTREYYVLVPVYDAGTKIFVPTDADSGKIRPVIDADTALSLIDSLPTAESVWVVNDKARQLRFSEILSHCDHKEMISLMRTLKNKSEETRDSGKKFHSADERAFREVKRILFGEFGFVLGITPKEVPGFIEERLKEA